TSSLSSYPRWSASGRKQATSESTARSARYSRGPILAPSRSLLSDGSTMSPPEDQRRNPRAPLRLRIDYERMNAFFADYTKNISKGGTFIKTTRPEEVGTRCQFALSLPARSEPLLMEGEVVWALSAEQARHSGAEPGMGARFVFADDAGRRGVERLLEQQREGPLGRTNVRPMI